MSILWARRLVVDAFSLPSTTRVSVPSAPEQRPLPSSAAFARWTRRQKSEATAKVTRAPVGTAAGPSSGFNLGQARGSSRWALDEVLYDRFVGYVEDMSTT
jgi:hypothetical protein